MILSKGESINPAIDIGQIEGAFIQGYGLFVLEEMMYSPTGVVYTRGPGTYKIPGFADIPVEFNVSLLKGAPNPRAVYSSKVRHYGNNTKKLHTNSGSYHNSNISFNIVC